MKMFDGTVRTSIEQFELCAVVTARMVFPIHYVTTVRSQWRIREEGGAVFNPKQTQISHLFLTRNIKAADLISSFGTWSINWIFVFIGAVFACPSSSPT